MGHKRTRNKAKKQQMPKQQNAPLIVVTTGGSGGHIFPAEAISAALLKKGYRVAFVTDRRGQAFRSLSGVQTYRLAAQGVSGRSFIKKAIGALKLLYGCAQALVLLQKIKPAAVVGVGGYASFPAVMAAHLWGIPVVLHEQNAVLGRANRILAKGTRLIATSFSPTKRVPSEIKQVRVGMPARPQILQKEHIPYPADNEFFNLLVFGGSQGASFFSHRFPEVLFLLPEELKKRLIVTQQARPEDVELLKKTYATQKFARVTISSFFDNMPELLSEAHLVISRGGASTITELEVIGRPAMIVPLPTAADNHQMENAKQFCDAGAGWLIAEQSFHADRMAERLRDLMSKPELLQKAAERAYGRSKPQAAAQIAEQISEIVSANETVEKKGK